MSAIVLDGEAIQIREIAKKCVAALKHHTGAAPGGRHIGGKNPASRLYFRNKMTACAEVGIRATLHEFDAAVDGRILIRGIEELNADQSVNGILV